MSSRRKTIPLSEAEKDLLQHLYLEFGIPSDQYERRASDQRRFVNRWNDLSERSDTEDEVMHYIITKRKGRQWVCFGGEHKRLDAMPGDFLSEVEWKLLETAYRNVCVSQGRGSDSLRFDRELSQALTDNFCVLSKRRINASLLLAAIECRRKRGAWITIGDRGIGFTDISEVG